MAYQFYQLPSPMPSFLELPLWLKDAIATQDVRLTADGEDMYVRTPVDEQLVGPSDYVVQSSPGNFYVMPAEVFETLAGIRATEPAPAPFPADIADPSAVTPHAGGLATPTPLGTPPYSSAVLARSARARAEQAAWEATPPPSDEPIPTPTADNARHEGADEPDPSR